MFNKYNLEFQKIPRRAYSIGSTLSEVNQCVQEWKKHLVDKSYTEKQFRIWIKKELPVHIVFASEYFIGKYPITNAQYQIFLNKSGYETIPESIQSNEGDDNPVWGVSIDDAKSCAHWYAKYLGLPLRLPSEYEWEIAARGIERLQYPYGETFSSKKGNTYETGIGHTTPVTLYEQYASPFGVVDMAGNVEEWVDTQYSPYPGGPNLSDDLSGTLGDNYFVLRGGSFARGGDLSRGARRHGPFPKPEFRYTGFRLAFGSLDKKFQLEETLLKVISLE
ncbi:MAG TPA: SUMF1/EgtB/PvdO family nonheme iron enzyme [Oligoflexia bacterium]|nr:SUMF1/EgtB/PvdO family nonheme iron enzyme [Oligoflexia bacterium]HMR25459.1 SUMF1/EgtB/PvdO family nonheme iron enzyme [Oligoflexia bacterium]